MKHKYKYLLFDMDGTIANTDELVVETMFELYDKYKGGQRKTREECYYFSGPPMRETVSKEFPGLDVNLLCQEFYDLSKPKYDYLVTPYEYCREVLLKLKNEDVRLAVVTNKKHDLALYCLKVIHLDDVFELVIGSDDVLKTKPNPEGVNKALEILGCLNKEEALYIGDNPLDLETSNNSSIDCVLVKWGPRKTPEDIKPKYFINDYRELLEVVL